MSITPTDLSQPVIISAALTGSWPTKTDNPAVPITEDEIADAALAAHKAGAAIVHLHVRNEQGKVTCDPARYAKSAGPDSGSWFGRDHQHVDGRRGGPDNRRAAHGTGLAQAGDRLVRLRLVQLRQDRFHQLAVIPRRACASA